MTETITRPQAAPHPAAPLIRPADVFMQLIVALLAPMFVGVSNGDIALARMAAAETINAYRARNQADLIAVVQIVAFGMAALASLSRSMEDDISLSMTLRLRGNANALNRSAEQNRRAIGMHGDAVSCGTEAEGHEDELSETDLLAGLQAARKLAEDTRPLAVETKQSANPSAAAPIPAAEPALSPGHVAAAVATAPSAPATVTPRTRGWANAMLETAANVTAGLGKLPLQERKIASIRAAALYSTATGLLSGDIQPALDPFMPVSPTPPAI